MYFLLLRFKQYSNEFFTFVHEMPLNHLVTGVGLEVVEGNLKNDPHYRIES